MSFTSASIGSHYLQISIQNFKEMKGLSDKALAQIQPEDYFWKPDVESNSVAILMQHIAGNMISRWSDFLTSDGEKATRNRDREFLDEKKSIEALQELWEKGWSCLFQTLSSLTEADLLKTITIRTEPHSVLQAINRQISHYGYHTGQLVYLCKYLKASAWKPLSIPRGTSANFLTKKPS